MITCHGCTSYFLLQTLTGLKEGSKRLEANEIAAFAQDRTSEHFHGRFRVTVAQIRPLSASRRLSCRQASGRLGVIRRKFLVPTETHSRRQDPKFYLSNSRGNKAAANLRPTGSAFNLNFVDSCIDLIMIANFKSESPGPGPPVGPHAGT